MSDLETVFAEAQQRGGLAAFARGYFDYLHRTLQQLDTDAIERFAAALIDACERESMIYFIGNGGSAATASHYANDLSFAARSAGCKPFRAVSLADNNAVVSCVSNDLGFEQLFTAQLDPLLREGDVVVAMSVSGNSDNVVRAVELANRRGATTVGLTGFDGGRLAETCRIHVHVPSNAGEYGPVEDVFQILDHMLTSYFQLQRRGRLVGGADAQHHLVVAPDPSRNGSADAPEIWTQPATPRRSVH
jgi:D-sedoheptulose 7-phosphate isomerase